MNAIGKKIVTILSVLLLLGGCTAVEFLPAGQNRASSASSAIKTESSSSEAVSSGRELATPAEVVIYRKLGDNPATHVENVSCDRSIYQPESGGDKLFDQWGLSKSVYVFIGWFYMDENNKPTDWTGDKDIRVQADEQTPIVAVFNVYYRKADAPPKGTLELYCVIDSNAPVPANIIPGISDYPLPTPPDAILKEQLPAKQAQLRFEGWFTADATGNPIAKLKDTQLRLGIRETLRITAVYSKAA